MTIFLSIVGKGRKNWILLFCGICILLFSFAAAAENEIPAKGKIGTEDVKQVKKRHLKEYSSLTVSRAVYKNGKLNIEGESDLPDDSILSINVIPISADDSMLSLSTKAIVRNGKYSAIITVPNNPKLYKGPYKIEVKFLLNMQTDIKVLHLLGDFAKNLTGKLVVLVPYTQNKSLLFSTVKKIWGLELKAYSVVKPKTYFPGEPKYILACFFQQWKQKDWKGMLKYSYHPWVKNVKTPVELLKTWLGSKKLIGAEIIDTPIANSLMTELNVKIFYLENFDEKMQVKSETGTVKVIKDDGDVWGVFPLSLMKKNAIYKMDL